MIDQTTGTLLGVIVITIGTIVVAIVNRQQKKAEEKSPPPGPVEQGQPAGSHADDAITAWRDRALACERRESEDQSEIRTLQAENRSLRAQLEACQRERFNRPAQED